MERVISVTLRFAFALAGIAGRLVDRADGEIGLVVAEACADGDLVASLGTPAAQHGCARLGLHAGQEPVGLGAVAAIRLEGTLRHWVRLLLNLVESCNGSSISVYRGFAEAAKKADAGGMKRPCFAVMGDTFWGEGKHSSQRMVQQNF